MKTPPIFGPVFRVIVALLLCSACFQAGRWYQELSGPAVAHVRATVDSDNEMVSSTYHGAPEPAPKTIEPTPLAAAGDPVGESGDVITPLNVRDPSALVMGPSSRECLPSTALVPEPSPVPAGKTMKTRKLKSGRLLELLKKGEEDKHAPSPKSF